jgi:hypothetical protein
MYITCNFFQKRYLGGLYVFSVYAPVDIRIYVTELFTWHVVRVKVRIDIVIYICCICVSAELIFPVLCLLLSRG